MLMSFGSNQHIHHTKAAGIRKYHANAIFQEKHHMVMRTIRPFIRCRLKIKRAKIGSAINAKVPAAACHLFDRVTGKRLTPASAQPQDRVNQ